MKKIILALIIVAAVFAVSCKASDKKAAAGEAAPEADKKAKAVDPSYAFGVAIGTSLKETFVKINYSAFLKGVKDVTEKNAPTMNIEEAGKVIQEAIAAAGVKKGEDNLAAEAAFFEKNGKKAGVITTASGLQYEVVKEGTGANPIVSDTVKVDYVGKLLDGSTFDSSIERGQPAEFPLEGVIPGWIEGIQLMKVGGKIKLYIPSKLAYGTNGAGGKIAANSTLVFDVELLEIVAPAAQ
jgi:FKBP-type peptidyl-prolyl cis-trans isomerase